MSISAKDIEFIKKELAEIKKELKENKKYTEQVILNNTTSVEQLSNAIEVKLDLLCNATNKTASKTASKTNKALSKAAFFKKIVKEDINKYVDILYTQENVDNLYEDETVKAKKTTSQKLTRVVELLYTYINKNNIDKANKIKELYDEYKKNLENESEETNSEE